MFTVCEECTCCLSCLFMSPRRCEVVVFIVVSCFYFMYLSVFIIVVITIIYCYSYYYVVVRFCMS